MSGADRAVEIVSAAASILGVAASLLPVEDEEHLQELYRIQRDAPDLAMRIQIHSQKEPTR